MPKLQKFKRANGSVVSSVNFPQEVMEALGWEKGDDLDMEVKEVRYGKMVMVFKKEDYDGRD